MDRPIRYAISMDPALQLVCIKNIGNKDWAREATYSAPKIVSRCW